MHSGVRQGSAAFVHPGQRDHLLLLVEVPEEHPRVRGAAGERDLLVDDEGLAVFGEVPSRTTLAGAAVVIAAGCLIIWRERQLGLERAREREAGRG